MARPMPRPPPVTNACGECGNPDMRFLPGMIVPPIYFNLQAFATKALVDAANAAATKAGPKIALSIKLSLPIPHRPVSIAGQAKGCRVSQPAPMITSDGRFAYEAA